MIRWSYLLPRLAIVAALAAIYGFGLNPLVRWALVSTGQSITGAKVELHSARASLVRGEVTLGALQIADPGHPMKNLLAAEQLQLDLETSALLRGKLIVGEARATGVRIDGDRATSGALDPAAANAFSLPGKELLKAGARQLAEQGRDWLEHAAAGLGEDLAREVERLESVRLAAQLAERWPRACHDLDAQIDGLRARIERLREGFARPPADPMRIIDHFRQLTAELESIQRDIEQFQRQIEELPKQASRDRAAIAAAARRDLDEVARRFHLDRPSPEQLSEYLLEREFGERVAVAARWIAWASRQTARAPSDRQLQRGRGVDVLPARPAEPDFLLRWLTLEGRAWCDGHPCDFLATVSGLTSQPQVVGQPTVVRAQVKLPTEIWIEATLDRTGAEPCDRFTVQCPAWNQPARTLGDPGQLALAVAPGTVRLALQVELHGRRLAGRLHVAQEPVELRAVVSPRCGGARLAEVLQAGLAQFRRIEADVALCGTADQPEWQLRSNLGADVAAAISTAFTRELELRRGELMAQVQRRIERELTGVDQLLAGKQQQLFDKLQGQIADARQLSQSLAQRVPLTPPALPFRF